MPQKPCPRCGQLIPYGMAYCATCAPIAEAQRVEALEHRAACRRRKYNRAYNARRDPKYTRFYTSKDWRRTSRAKLQAVGYKCEARLEHCTRLAVEVHHIKPIQTPEGWDLRLDWDNLEAVCTACHNGRHPEKLLRRRASADPYVLDLQEIQKKL